MNVDLDKEHFEIIEWTNPIARGLAHRNIFETNPHHESSLLSPFLSFLSGLKFDRILLTQAPLPSSSQPLSQAPSSLHPPMSSSSSSSTTTTSSATSRSPPQKRPSLALIEDVPHIHTSQQRDQFQEALWKHLKSNRGAPIVLIISDANAGTLLFFFSCFAFFAFFLFYLPPSFSLLPLSSLSLSHFFSYSPPHSSVFVLSTSLSSSLSFSSLLSPYSYQAQATLRSIESSHQHSKQTRK